jgi:hypothetical protein
MGPWVRENEREALAGVVGLKRQCRTETGGIKKMMWEMDLPEC